MNERFNGLIWIGVGVSLLMVLFLSPFASSSPDGLEKVAEMERFKERGEGWKLWKYAPLPDYAIPWIGSEKVSKAISGLSGTVAVFLITFGFGKWMKRSPLKRITPASDTNEVCTSDRNDL